MARLSRLLPGLFAAGVLVAPTGTATAQAGGPGEASAAKDPAADDQAYLTVLVDPPEALLFIDGELQPADSTGSIVELTPGEHRIEARFEGYAPAWRVVTLKAGRDNDALRLKLRPTAGILTLYALEPATPLWVDGEPVGQGQWEGVIPIGVHTVRIGEGDGSRELAVMITPAGEHQVLQEQHGELRTNSPPPGSSAVSRPYRPPLTTPPLQGFYVHGYGALLTPLTGAVDHERSDRVHGGPGGSLRIGYRFAAWGGAELLVQYAALSVTGSLPTRPQADYDLGSIRFGPAFRLMVPARTVARFIATIGAGPVFDILSWYPSTGGTPYQDVVGWNGFGQLELGAQLEWSNLLADFVVQTAIQSTGGLAVDEVGTSAFDGSPMITIGPMIGLGYGFW
ncbi:MAG: hypothetical protein JRI68_07910 [Deltaproteobacteria bacterium]|nr:hypothetical protein [Deltaproteobacteria bacterium]